MERGLEVELRNMIFDHLAKQVANKGTLTRSELAAFPVGGRIQRLIDQNKGIWNPRDFAATLSIMSKPDSPYDDAELDDSTFIYAYRDGSTDSDNRKLRIAHEEHLPLILLRWIEKGVYVPVFPVYVIHDDFERRRFILALDERLFDAEDPVHLKPIERSYAQAINRKRLHQPEFRGRIMTAYGNKCSVCKLGHRQLLDAAHITPDGEEHGTPEVENGLCLCKLHHSAYDTNLIGISPDYQVVISKTLFDSRDESPVVEHGFLQFDGQSLAVPRSPRQRPSPERLDERFAAFKAAS
ncbi:HNH endonuclease [Nocardia sp. CA-290969]|uniref:HNH endonuclease n=1 Tax=Nocardia sp. CA-290969 TaxID=3239986 RepID=UPI003D94AC81